MVIILKKAMIYIHGRYETEQAAQKYKDNCQGYELYGFKYSDSENAPWLVDEHLKELYDSLRGEYEAVGVIGNSIGAYFAMYSLSGRDVEKALFISPLFDVEGNILSIMRYYGLTEAELKARGEVKTKYGRLLSWPYLEFVRKTKLSWKVPTYILYGENDRLNSRESIERFAAEHSAELSVMPGGEHWFHTEEQLAFLNSWMKSVLSGYQD